MPPSPVVMILAEWKLVVAMRPIFSAERVPWKVPSDCAPSTISVMPWSSHAASSRV